MRTVAPVSPGEMLEEEFLKPLGLTKYRLAKDIGVPPQRIGDIVAGKRAISADTDLVCAVTSGSVTDGGSAVRPTTTRQSREKPWVKPSHAFLAVNCWLPEHSAQKVGPSAPTKSAPRLGSRLTALASSPPMPGPALPAVAVDADSKR